jgi:hypothetical protein
VGFGRALQKFLICGTGLFFASLAMAVFVATAILNIGWNKENRGTQGWPERQGWLAILQ